MSGHGLSLPDGRYAALLFDMDGTILNSIAAAERIWSAWATRHGLDVAAFLPTIHGARAVDTISRLALPGVDPEIEAQGITDAEIEDVEGIVEVPGAENFLKSLPVANWAVVTSAPKALALQRMKAAGIPVPAVLVTSEDVAAGKPNPDCYLLAAKRLEVDIADCLIFEDAAVGIAAGEAAGAPVLVVTSTHLHPMETAHATIRSYEGIVAKAGEGGFIQLEDGGI
ncbi:HAD hydrolase, IA, variant 1 family protein [Collimonas arenae]|uniref:HAD hydrolase, IA, variant 1 family protein n=1 Tax=Collimonas arenae TaxID=279058 RepID=A0A127QG87_9BURK|nr:HAD-IA family hydrolase [Collimonas arenae]AMO99163.1 HAD hydrolase, IA, variant 1 family protein [Collimonas arenae]AMP09061.1 HAD hydrolase, IA, variant 1 family protein [Collimonas arenae]